MPDEHSEKIVKALEEIRDLLKERNQYEQSRVLVLGRTIRQISILLVLLFVMIFGWFAFTFWTAPQAQRRMEQQGQQILQMQSNALSQPH